MAWEILKTPSGLWPNTRNIISVINRLDDYMPFHTTKLRIKPKNVTKKKRIQSQFHVLIPCQGAGNWRQFRDHDCSRSCPKTGITDQQNKATNINTAWTILHENETGLFLIESKTGITLRVNFCTNGYNLSCNLSAPGSPGVLVVNAKGLD